MNLPAVKLSATELANALGHSKVSETGGGGIGGYLRFAFETGEWTYGRDQEEVTDDTIVVNTAQIGHGWVLWHQGEADKKMVRFNEELPEPMEAIEWVDKQQKKQISEPSQARTFSGVFLDEGQPGEPLQFDTNSYGGRQGVDALLAAIKARAASGETDLFPVVKLSSDSYYNKAYSKEIHNPVFEIVGWMNEMGEPAEQAEEPKKVTKAKAEKAEEPKQDEKPAPRRRRRRSAS